MPLATPTDRLGFLSFLYKGRDLILPIAAVSLIFVMLIPLPTWLMDVFLAANLALAAVVLLTTIYITSPLEFSVFPSMLLAATLFRLVLNCATTRLILTAGDRQGDVTAAAGHVIQAFGNFVAGGSLAVGMIIFIILIVIQFVVITKGATRISEVAARFTLDGMPGKQMAIDADLNAGLINEVQARQRREVISREADFYGAMDGASKFVRGDAIAGIIITLVNIAGGLAVGMLQYGWDLSTCFRVFTKLTIGDGLVSQVPAFIISISAGLIVTRSTAQTNLGQELIDQLGRKPRALFVAAGFLIMLIFAELPALPLLFLAGSIGGAGYIISRSEKRKLIAQASTQQQAAPAAKAEKIEELLPVDRMELEIGYALIRMVDEKQGGDLLQRISMIRRQIAVEMGIIVPSIRIRDNVRLGPNDYAIKIKGVELARGQAYMDQFLAMDSGAVTGKISGLETTEPAFGLPAVWVPAARKEQAEMMNYTVVDCSSVVATHLTEVIKTHAAELLSRQDLNSLLDTVKERSPAVVEEVVGGTLKAGDIQKVIQALLEERVPVRDMETILETLGDWGSRTQDLEVLTEYVRNALARNICSQYRGEDGRLRCVTLDPALEDTINRHIERNDRGSYLTLPPALARQIVDAVSEQLKKLIELGGHPIVLCSPQIRLMLRRLLAQTLPGIAVLAYNEIVKEVQIESVAMVTIEQPVSYGTDNVPGAAAPVPV
ncbi:MAG: flagellar biosynthesis protein FlhA [Sedimentisphaerales bacterium]|nr:flagellar biosynthesis protein FlhA [Sedimentisphaerales bacterium]